MNLAELVTRFDPQLRELVATIPPGRTWVDALTEGVDDQRALASAVTEARTLFNREAAQQSMPRAAVTTANLLVTIANRRLRIRSYEPSTVRSPSPWLLYAHGGGFVVGSIDTHDAIARNLCINSNMKVFSVDYRLIPESVYPDAVHDFRVAAEWIHAHARPLGLDPDRWAAVGDSAGGTLAATVALDGTAMTIPGPAAQVLMYPALDPALDSESMREYGELLSPSIVTLGWMWKTYLSYSDLQSYRAQFLTPERPSPRTLVLTAEFDPLRDEGEQYARRLRDCGSSATYIQVPGVIHGFLRLPLAATTRAFDQIGTFLREALTDVDAAYPTPTPRTKDRQK